MRLALLGTVPSMLLAMIGAAEAQELPRYDVQIQCKRVASVGGNYSAMLYESCFDMEQTAYDKLKTVWLSLPGEMRAQCDRVARVGGAGSYSLLESCLDMERQSQERSRGKSFKY